jgi:hypothetical protein
MKWLMVRRRKNNRPANHRFITKDWIIEKSAPIICHRPELGSLGGHQSGSMLMSIFLDALESVNVCVPYVNVTHLVTEEGEGGGGEMLILEEWVLIHFF